ncbi:hypothetical protein MBENS4_3603 [Novosphingobium sp. MBES04]|uniref:Hpt domain-containing protein n=1 Tax=Novosphingobium sp. MBES04 TaxID=1206458 RepID=UPI0007237A4F|nr:Hpt domain-containing protein [Novosphingobium sp. MBES04]GAM06606.1 hypothetical protein MBENS4_3603 [Novosphingobium sp. MBES04]
MSEQDPAAAFRIEAADLLDATEQALLDLTHDLASRDLVDTVFRGMHTLKGSGAMFGFDALAAFTHHCETAFDKVRKGVVPASAELVAITLGAMDHMRTLVDLEGDDPALEEAGNAILERLHTALGSAPEAGGEATPAAQPLPTANATAAPGGWHIVFRLPAEAMANGTNPLILLDEMRELGDAEVRVLTDTVPPLDELDPTLCYLGWDVTLKGPATREDIEDVFIFVMDDMDLSIEALESDAPPAAGAVQSAAPASAPAPAESPRSPAPRSRAPLRKACACPPAGSTS